MIANAKNTDINAVKVDLMERGSKAEVTFNNAAYTITVHNPTDGHNPAIVYIGRNSSSMTYKVSDMEDLRLLLMRMRDETMEAYDRLVPAKCRSWFDDAEANGAKVAVSRFPGSNRVTVDIVIDKETSHDMCEYDGEFYLFATFQEHYPSKSMHAYYHKRCGSAIAEYGLDDVPIDSNAPLSVRRLIEEASTCPHCGRVVPLDEMKVYAFASRACDRCVDEQAAKLPAGWYN